ncbi:MAG: MarR family transcriptional regulator [Hyphomonadaceae bacterium]|nr:MarR family transcriptional regulator [Hyphomonadaceae bacterium]
MDVSRNLIPSHFIVALLQGFYWFDEGLQNYLGAKHWPEITRPQSMLMANLALGVTRPSDMARRLGVSRQTVHVTLAQMVEKGVLTLVDDPEDRRMKVVALTPLGAKMKADAQRAMDLMVEELSRRIGPRRVAQLNAVNPDEWGPPMTFEDVPRPRQKS